MNNNLQTDNDLDRARQSFYNSICSDCEDFYNEIREEMESQSDIEVFFLGLWKRLSVLFESQGWDYGEFRKLSWDEARELLMIKRGNGK